MVFSYFKKLSKFVPIDRDILESTFVEYKSEKDEVTLKSKLFPVSDEFEEEYFPNVFKNIFVKYKKIFADEIWEYQIVKKGGDEVLETDCVQFNKDEYSEGSRFILINDMEDLPDSKEQEMKEKMISFVYKDELVKSLFTLM